MKRKSLRTLVCALLASLALTTFAFADNGPKPQLIVRVKNAPQEPYYLDLLAPRVIGTRKMETVSTASTGTTTAKRIRSTPTS